MLTETREAGVMTLLCVFMAGAVLGVFVAVVPSLKADS